MSQFATFAAFDFRGHGSSTITESPLDLSASKLIEQSVEVLEFLAKMYPEKIMILVGHSMGGAIAVKTAEEVKLKQADGLG